MLSCFSHVQLFVTLWTIGFQAPLSTGFSKQECWSGLPCLPPGDLPNPGAKPASLMSPALAGGFFTTRATWETPFRDYICLTKELHMIKSGKAYYCICKCNALTRHFSFLNNKGKA